MVLTVEDFAGWRINWDDKAANVAALTAELNLGLQSVVFIDDNPVERDRVREALPEVLVPDRPSSALLFPSALASLDSFDSVTADAEDRPGISYQAKALSAGLTPPDRWIVAPRLGQCPDHRAQRRNSAR